jgi:transposase
MSWRQGQAYSQDLRERVLAAVDGGIAVREAAPLFRVSIAFIYKALIRRRLTGETTARPQRCQLEPKLAAYYGAIRAEVGARPDVTISELREWLVVEHGVSVSHSVMWTSLDRLGLTLKKRRSTRPSRIGRTSPPRGRPGASASPE